MFSIAFLFLLINSQVVINKKPPISHRWKKGLEIFILGG